MKKPLFIDLETTGLNPETDEVIEIAVVKKCGTVILNALIKPETKTEWPNAQKINKISPTMVQNKQTINSLTHILVPAFKNRTVYAWNAPFDYSFMPALLKDANVICAMKEYSDYIQHTQPQNASKTGRYKLSDVAKELGIKIKGNPHRALTDVQTMMEVRRIYLNPSFNRTDLNSSINTEPCAK